MPYFCHKPGHYKKGYWKCLTSEKMQVASPDEKKRDNSCSIYTTSTGNLIVDSGAL